MSNCGRYEPVRDLYRGELGYVAEARLADKPGKVEFVIKSCSIESTTLDRAAAEREVRAFADRVSVMQRVGQNEHWAPVLEATVTPTQACYVTRLYPGSLEQLAGGQVRIDQTAMYNIVRGIVSGLKELRDACGRPHGALKGSNILRDRVGQLGTVVVKLTDPAPSDSPQLARGEACDLRAIGGIIYHLITFKPYREVGGWPISKTADWSKLLDRADGWFALTERMLDPQTPDQALTLDWLDSELRALRAGRSGGGNNRLKIAAIWLLAAAAVGAPAVWWFALRQAPTTENGPDSLQGQEAIFRQWIWAGVLLNDLAQGFNQPARQTALEHLPEPLRTVLMSISADGGSSFLPQSKIPNGRSNVVLADKSEFANESLASEPIKSLDLTGMHKTVIDAVHAFRTQEPARLRKAKQASEAFEKLGWKLAAQTTRAAAEPMDTLSEWFDALQPTNSQSHREIVSACGGRAREMLDAWPALVAAESELDRALDAANRLHETWNRLQQSGLPGIDRVQSGLIVMDARAAESRSLNERYAILAGAAGSVHEALGGLHAARSRVQTMPSDFAPPPADEDLTQWLFVYAASLSQIAEARPPVIEERDLLRDWRSDFGIRADSLRTELSQLRGRMAENAGPAFETLRDDIDMRLKELSALLERSESARQKGRDMQTPEADVYAERDELDRKLGELRTRQREIAGLYDQEMRRAGQSRQALVNRIADWQLPGAPPALDQVIRAQRNDLSRRLQDGDPEDQILALLNASESAAQRASDAIQRFRRPATPAFIALTSSQRDALAAAIDREHEVRRTTLAEAVSLAYDRARPDAQRLQTADFDALDEAEALSAWGGDTQRLFDHLLAAENLVVTQLRPLDESPGSGARSAAEEFAQARRLAPFARLEQELGPVLDHERTLQRILQQRDPNQLLEQARDQNNLVTALAAWRQLGSAPGWPTIESINDDLVRTKELRARISARRDLPEHRRTDLDKELNTESARRFTMAYNTVASSDQLRAARRLEREYAAFNRDDLARRTRANLLVMEFEDEFEGLRRAEPAPITDETAFVERVARLRSNLEALGDAAKPHADWAAAILEAAEKTEAPTTERDAKITNIPEGWQQVPVARGGDIAIERNGQRLEFARVDGITRGDGSPVFLAVHELSVGQLREIARSITTPAVRQRLTAPDASTLSSWTINPRGEIIARRSWWLDNRPGESAVYPAGFQARLEDGWPTDDSPAQNLTAEVADELAKAIGCRLPTLAEWQAAARSELAVRPLNSLLDDSNLRDMTWMQILWHNFERQQAQRSNIEPYKGKLERTTARRRLVGADDADQPSHVNRDDGAPWFWSVYSGPETKFKNLFGNVAEFAAKEPGSGTLVAVGLSAISPPSADLVTTEFELSRPRLARFSDVGIRLAFDAVVQSGPVPMARRVAPLVGNPAYVWGE
ncbi:MAG: hypothetical protein KIT24_10865 [Phycisphaeraceae bacterium]|nr:hypothetical protein [Phycisphaeraceae bacterium]